MFSTLIFGLYLGMYSLSFSTRTLPICCDLLRWTITDNESTGFPFTKSVIWKKREHNNRILYEWSFVTIKWSMWKSNFDKIAFLIACIFVIKSGITRSDPFQFVVKISNNFIQWQNILESCSLINNLDVYLTSSSILTKLNDITQILRRSRYCGIDNRFLYWFDRTDLWELWGRSSNDLCVVIPKCDYKKQKTNKHTYSSNLIHKQWTKFFFLINKSLWCYFSFGMCFLLCFLFFVFVFVLCTYWYKERWDSWQWYDLLRTPGPWKQKEISSTIKNLSLDWK